MDIKNGLNVKEAGNLNSMQYAKSPSHETRLMTSRLAG